MHSIPRPPSHSQSGEIIIDYENESYHHQTQEFMRHLPAYTKKYIVGLFPIATWLHRYNLQVQFLLSSTDLHVEIDSPL